MIILEEWPSDDPCPQCGVPMAKVFKVNSEGDSVPLSCYCLKCGFEVKFSCGAFKRS